MANNGIEHGHPQPHHTAQHPGERSSGQSSDISVLPAIWVLKATRRKVADAWLKRGCITHECAASSRSALLERLPGSIRRICQGDRAIGRRLTNCHDFDSLSRGDVIVVPINRRVSRLGVVVAAGCDRAHDEREVLWVTHCPPNRAVQKADELRVMSQLKQLG